MRGLFGGSAANVGGVHLVCGAVSGSFAVFGYLVTITRYLIAQPGHKWICNSTPPGDFSIRPPAPFRVRQQPHHRPTLVLICPALTMLSIGNNGKQNGVSILRSTVAWLEAPAARRGGVTN
jgi:hypothetical protein